MWSPGMTSLSALPTFYSNGGNANLSPLLTCCSWWLRIYGEGASSCPEAIHWLWNRNLCRSLQWIANDWKHCKWLQKIANNCKLLLHIFCTLIALLLSLRSQILHSDTFSLTPILFFSLHVGTYSNGNNQQSHFLYAFLPPVLNLRQCSR